MAELSELKCLSCGYCKPLADYDASQMAKVPFGNAVKCNGCMNESVENAKKLKCSDCGKLDADFSKTQKKKAAKHGYAKCKDCTAKGNGPSKKPKDSIDDDMDSQVDEAVLQVLARRQELEARHDELSGSTQQAKSSIDDDSQHPTSQWRQWRH